MLELLHIENIAVIEEADIQFRPGFNALTGETGAGKSIVIDAMGAVLGGRTSRDLIRTGAAKAFVSAEFSGVPADLPGLAENGFAPDEDGNLLLQREISGDGKNACRINGRPLTVAQLRQIGGELLNIHGQHDGTQLLDEEQHGAYLDRFGRTESPFTAYRNAYTAMTDLRNQINALQMDEAEKARRVDSLRFQIDELERAELQPGEEEELEARRNLLRNGEKYLSALTGADYCLNGDDDSAGAVGQLGDAEAALAGIRTLDNEVLEVYNRLGALQSEAYDLAETVRDLRSAFDFSPEELDAAESRADQLYRLKKKYGATVQDMLDYLDKCQKELDAIETADDTLIQLEQKLKKARKEVLTA
ncbi:MAG: AAA family ATPase, partial [Oscillibacter sp.]|nr:AAA family ATPase [Oscillibacter sp.]